MSGEILVLDASVGVKWVKEESASREAEALLTAHAAGEATLAVPDVFVYELLDVTRRLRGIESAAAVWQRLSIGGPFVVPTHAADFPAVLEMCTRLGCTTYDAAAPALAERLHAVLVSADAKAHGGFPGVRLIG